MAKENKETIDISPKLMERLNRILEQGITDSNDVALDMEAVVKMANADPSKRGRYLRWMTDLYKHQSAELFFEDLYKVTETLELFEKVKHNLTLDQRNVLNYKTCNDLWDVVKPFKGKQETILSKRQLRGDTPVDGEFDVLLDNEKYCVVVPKTHRAACYWGSGSRWCTAHDKYAGHYHNYADKGPLLILRYHGDDPKKNVQINIETSQYMNNEDRSIDPEKFFNDYPDVLEAFIEYIEAGTYNAVRPPEDMYFQKAFIKCLEQGKSNMARIYIAHGADVDGIKGSSISGIPLIQALSNNNGEDAIGMIKLLIKNGAKLNYDEGFINTAHVVATTGNVDILEILLDHGLNINVKDMNGNTPLHAAMLYGKFEMTKRLMELGLDPNEKNDSGLTPLKLVEQYQHNIKLTSS